MEKPSILIVEDGRKVVELIKILVKPLDIITLKERIEELLNKREHKDSIYGLSLAAIMQVLEMEQRTRIMTVKAGDRKGRIFFKAGKVAEIEAGEATRAEALIGFLDPVPGNKDIGIEYLDHRKKVKLNQFFTQVLLEASRRLDEKEKNRLNHRVDTGETAPEQSGAA